MREKESMGRGNTFPIFNNEMICAVSQNCVRHKLLLLDCRLAMPGSSVSVILLAEGPIWSKLFYEL